MTCASRASRALSTFPGRVHVALGGGSSLVPHVRENEYFSVEKTQAVPLKRPYLPAKGTFCDFCISFHLSLSCGFYFLRATIDALKSRYKLQAMEIWKVRGFHTTLSSPSVSSRATRGESAHLLHPFVIRKIEARLVWTFFFLTRLQ